MSGGWDLSLDAMTELAHAFKTREYQTYLDRYADSMAKTGKVFDLESGEVKEAADKPGERERVDRMIEAGKFPRKVHIGEFVPFRGDNQRFCIAHCVESRRSKFCIGGRTGRCS